MIDQILTAMRADCIPEGESGRWYIKRRNLDAFQCLSVSVAGGRNITPGLYTFLHCYTDATLMKGGECVMNDYQSELKTHLNFVLKSHGKVLVGGLGLGCVLRGLLTNTRVQEIHVIERSDDVIKLVWPSVVHPKIILHHCDVKDFVSSEKWDSIWWDFWSDPVIKEPNLAVTHMHCIQRFMNNTKQQGAWALPRRFRRTLRSLGVM